MTPSTARLETESSLHPCEDDLEAFVMGGMSAPDRARLQAHVRVCSACGEALAESFRYVEAMRSALRDI